MKLNEKIEAIRLRKLGESYSYIYKKVKVSKSTLSLWLRDIELTPEQKAGLKGRQKSRYEGAKANQRKRIERTKQIINEAQKEIKLFSKNPLFSMGLMLYWAEGSKRGEQIDFSNSDPGMIKLMMLWFRKICKVPEEKFRIKLYIHSLHSRKNVKKYWSELTDIPLSQFHKTYIKSTSLRYRKYRLYNGTCAIRISNKDLFRRIKGWKLGFLEKMNIKIKEKDMPL